MAAPRIESSSHTIFYSCIYIKQLLKYKTLKPTKASHETEKDNPAAQGGQIPSDSRTEPEVRPHP
ncbi:MAG: hypothetical protein II381_13255, partial [Victivallales bacterium]|nr:hypothetical protein [Victivallales bacterium]